MAQCPTCDISLPEPMPSLCPACGASLGLPTRSNRAPARDGAGDALVVTSAMTSSAMVGPQSNPSTLGASTALSGEVVLFDGKPAAIASIADLLFSILTLGIYAIVLAVRASSTQIRVTNHRVVIDRGIFSKRLEQIDLYRVVDYVVERPFGQRLMNTGNLIIETNDRTSKELRLDRLRTDVRELYEKLRAATELDKQNRGIRRFE